MGLKQALSWISSGTGCEARWNARSVRLLALARIFAEAEGLMAYGSSLREQFRRAAIYVDKIPQRRQARRPPRRTADEVRIRHQPEDGPIPWPRPPAIAPVPGRRDDPVNLSGAPPDRTRLLAWLEAHDLALARDPMTNTGHSWSMAHPGACTTSPGGVPRQHLLVIRPVVALSIASRREKAVQAAAGISLTHPTRWPRPLLPWASVAATDIPAGRSLSCQSVIGRHC